MNWVISRLAFGIITMSRARLTKTVDYDAEHKITWRKALQIACCHYGYKQENLKIMRPGGVW